MRSDGIYNFQTCNGEYKISNTILEDCYKECVIANLAEWKKEHPENNNLIILRTFNYIFCTKFYVLNTILPE